MNYPSVYAFLDESIEESEKTQAVLSVIPDSALAQRAFQGGFSVAELAWHLTDATIKISAQLGIAPITVQQPAFDSSQKLLEAYRAVMMQFRTNVVNGVEDSTLSEFRMIYGMDWTVSYALSIILKHEIHHRGQLVQLLRMAGVRPPATYGPPGKF